MQVRRWKVEGGNVEGETFPRPGQAWEPAATGDDVGGRWRRRACGSPVAGEARLAPTIPRRTEDPDVGAGPRPARLVGAGGTCRGGTCPARSQGGAHDCGEWLKVWTCQLPKGGTGIGDSFGGVCLPGSGRGMPLPYRYWNPGRSGRKKWGRGGSDPSPKGEEDPVEGCSNYVVVPIPTTTSTGSFGYGIRIRPSCQAVCRE